MNSPPDRVSRLQSHPRPSWAPRRLAACGTALALVAALTACGEDALVKDAVEEDTAADTTEVLIPDTGTPDVVIFDTREPDTDTSPEDTADADTTIEEVGPSCSDALKPFYCPCDTNSQCASTMCIAVDDDDVARRCSIDCFGDTPCPNGWECKGIGIGQEQQFACMPPVVTLCKPCERAADCQKVGSLCIGFPDGKFCGQDCQHAPNSCPAGYACEEVVNEVGQIDGYQCMRTSGSCICPDGTDYQNDPEHCGHCGKACHFAGAEAGCRDGGCYLKSCLNDWKDLNGVEADGCEYRCTFQSAEDWPDASCDAVNGCDQNCDGIDGDYARAIFVSATGTANAAGTPYDPVRTIGEGLAKATPAGRNHVYVAAGTYNEVVTLKKGVSIFGGYSNDGKWTRNLALHKTQITSSTGASSVRVVIAEGIDQRTVLDGVEVLAGTNANPGGSSYAVWVKDSTNALELVRVTAIGGNGGAGANGANGTQGAEGAVGTKGVSSSEAEGGATGSCTDCNCNHESKYGGPGGSGAPNACGSGNNSGGGRGGNSKCGSGNAGLAGSPSPGGAAGGIASTGVGNNGTGGSNGGTGTHGSAGTPLGAVSGSGLWSGIDGGAGGRGDNGVGGGGGSGGGGHDNGVSCASWGGGGGGGGSGGCGGTGGQGGRAGGGSFGLFLHNSSPKLTHLALGHRSGGNGGRGGDGGIGGNGKDGGLGGIGCFRAGDGGKGGKGGNGGRGGHGGGGAGGVAFGLYLHGTSNPTCTGLQFNPAGSGGTGGIGGTSPGNRGIDGAFGDRFGTSPNCP